MSRIAKSFDWLTKRRIFEPSPVTAYMDHVPAQCPPGTGTHGDIGG
jgi:hypothetical protein